MPRRDANTIKKICGPVFLLAILNFLVFVVVTLSIGGYAMSGRIANGRYYVGSHGVYTQVSPGVFRYSQIHFYGVWATHCLALLAGGAYEWARMRAKRVTADNPGVERPPDD